MNGVPYVSSIQMSDMISHHRETIYSSIPIHTQKIHAHNPHCQMCRLLLTICENETQKKFT